VQRHEGVIEIDSTPGQGTSIRLVLPVRQEALAAVQATGPASKSERSLRILCIDDEEPIRLLLNDCLTHFSHQVVTAASGEQGLEFFRAARLKNNPFEAVITDLGMPKMDGHQLARCIKAESPHTPIVMLTGWGTMMQENSETAPEVDAVVGKPPQLQELHDLLLRVTAKNKRRA
jgi:CheY-like chemotaxis protein